MKSPKAVECLFDSAHGQYIPELFAENCQQWCGIDQDEFRILRKGPENVHYWNVWENVLNNAFYNVGWPERKFKLWSGENGDLFAYCEAEMTEEEKQNLFGAE